MTGSGNRNADAWGLPGVVQFFDNNRVSSRDVYPSEWRFLSALLKEHIRVLDVGCAQGGFAAIIGEHVADFEYVGLDINADMIARARAHYPRHTYHVIEEGKFELGGGPFDLVLVLGILHLHERWRETLSAAWSHTGGVMLFDLRETDRESIEDINKAYFRMDFGAADARHSAIRLPYNIINEREAERVVRNICNGATQIEEYGYHHRASSSAVTPYSDIIARVWCARR